MEYKLLNKTEENLELIKELAGVSGIKEEIDYDCDFIVAKNEQKELLGLAGINLKMEKYPQFKHIILRPEKQTSRLGIILMNKMERYLIDNGYENKEYVSYILNTDNRMQVYAKKWGMIPYENDKEGVWFYKKILKGGSNV